MDQSPLQLNESNVQRESEMRMQELQVLYLHIIVCPQRNQRAAMWVSKVWILFIHWRTSWHYRRAHNK